MLTAGLFEAAAADARSLLGRLRGGGAVGWAGVHGVIAGAVVIRNACVARGIGGLEVSCAAHARHDRLSAGGGVSVCRAALSVPMPVAEVVGVARGTLAWADGLESGCAEAACEFVDPGGAEGAGVGWAGDTGGGARGAARRRVRVGAAG